MEIDRELYFDNQITELIKCEDKKFDENKCDLQERLERMNRNG